MIEEMNIFEYGLSNAKSKRKIGKKIEARNEKLLHQYERLKSTIDDSPSVLSSPQVEQVYEQV